MAEIQAIKYLDHSGLVALWDKISNTYLRQSAVVSALTEFGESKIIVEEGDTFIQKKTFDGASQEIWEKIEELQNGGIAIDEDTIIKSDNVLKTDLLLSNDADKHVLSLVTGKGSVVSSWDYDEFYQEAVKDGMIKNVSLVVVPDTESEATSGQAAGTYLKFEFNTDGGDKVIYIDVDDLIDVYTGSDYIKIEHSNNADGTPGSVSISLEKAKLINDLKSEDVFGIDSIIIRLESIEEKNSQLESLVKELQEAWEAVDLNALYESIESLTGRVDNIEEVLKTVPTVRITEEEIDALE